MRSGDSVLFKYGVNKPQILVFLSLALGLGFLTGILIGRYPVCDESKRERMLPRGTPEQVDSGADLDISKRIMNSIDPARIEANLRILSEKPHIAGRQRDFELVKLIKDRFVASGLEVQITPYDVLLSYPDNVTRNSVRLLDEHNNVVYDAVKDESDISKLDDVLSPFNAYSPSGLVEGNLVFAGYGRVEDYIWLRQNNISVAGNLVIVKYGEIYRGDKVDLAADNGATGIIIYSDPADYTGNIIGDPRVYPDTWWLPPSGVQRGSIFSGDGDPLTPGYPSTDLAYRYPENEVVPPLPKIPCHPIGYGAAVNILRHMGGLEVPSTSDLRGGLNITYRTGPEFLQPGMKIQLNVTTRNQRAKVENVFGIIKGTVEPDRYVLFGNHRDAWIYGAIDPSSGTAVMMEMARVMGELVASGEWQPRRSIIFCSWGAEEYGLVGSVEWVEQYVSILRERAVAYINVDLALHGNDTLTAAATPLMYNIVHEASQKIKNPNPAEFQDGRPTVYDTWLHVSPWNFTQGNKSVVPLIESLGSGSDFAPFIQRAGVPTTDLSYTYDINKYKMASYPLYHTEFETFDLVKNQYDRDFEFHTAVARVSSEMIYALADSLIIPFNVTNYAVGLELIRQTLDKDYGYVLTQILGQDTYGKMKMVIEGFTKDVADFEARKMTLNKMNPYALRQANDQIMLLEKAFLHPDGLPRRPLKKHLIFAENINDVYAGSSFPGLVDLLFQIGDDRDRWEKVRQHFHTILNTIQAAGSTLREVTMFMSETL